MARKPNSRSFFAQLSTRGKPKARMSKNAMRGDRKRKQMRRERAMKYGAPGITDKLSILKADKHPWVVERKERHELVREQYQKDRHNMLLQKRKADKLLSEELERKKKEVDVNYRLSHYDKDDPRLGKVQRRAQEVYARSERQAQRRHHEDWKTRFRRLKIDRDKQYRQITKDMKLESRMARGMPGSKDFGKPPGTF